VAQPASFQQESGPSHAEHQQKDPVVTTLDSNVRKQRVYWTVIDATAPAIFGSKQLVETTRACGLQRMQSACNDEYSTYHCLECGEFFRRFCWDKKVARAARVIMTKLPNDPVKRDHKPTCSKASCPWRRASAGVPDSCTVSPHGLSIAITGSMPEPVSVYLCLCESFVCVCMYLCVRMLVERLKVFFACVCVHMYGKVYAESY